MKSKHQTADCTDKLSFPSATSGTKALDTRNVTKACHDGCHNGRCLLAAVFTAVMMAPLVTRPVLTAFKTAAKKYCPSWQPSAITTGRSDRSCVRGLTGYIMLWLLPSAITAHAIAAVASLLLQITRFRLGRKLCLVFQHLTNKQHRFHTAYIFTMLYTSKCWSETSPLTPCSGQVFHSEKSTVLPSPGKRFSRRRAHYYHQMPMPSLDPSCANHNSYWHISRLSGHCYTVIKMQCNLALSTNCHDCYHGYVEQPLIVKAFP